MTADKQIPLIVPMPKHDDQPEVTARLLTIPSAYLEIPESSRLDLNLLRLIDADYTPEEIRRIHSLQRFTIPLCPAEIPAELLALSDEAPVIGIESSGTFDTTAAKLAGYIRETIERQAAGRFYLWEAAQILAETHEKSPQGIKNAMRKAFSLGVLRVRMTDSDAPMDSDSRLRVEGMDSYVTPCDLNKWLETDGYPYRFPAAPEPASTPIEEAAAPIAAPSASAHAVAVPERVAAPVADPDETTQERQDRRLRELRADGAEFIVTDREKRHGQVRGGKRGALARLTAREQAAGRPMSTKDGVRQDLVSAVMREVGRNGRLSR